MNMSMAVNLSDIIEAIESADDSSEYYLDRVTGEVVWISQIAMSRAEQEEAFDVLDEHGFYRLPEQRDINDYRIMEEFIASLPSGEAQEGLSRAIDGQGAFRRFKDTVKWLGIENDWYEWKESSYRRLAIKWCEENELDYE